jgi:hypothetical protein
MSNTPVVQRTRFRYRAGDKVIATTASGQERPGVIEAQVQDPSRQPYVVRYHPTLDDPQPDPVNGFFEEHQLRRNLSPAFTVVFEEGAREVYERILKRLDDLQGGYVMQAVDEQDLAARRARERNMADSFWRTFAFLVMRAIEYDGTLHIAPWSHDSDNLSFGFRYERSGFDGGLIFHGELVGSGGERHPLLGEWSLHS